MASKNYFNNLDSVRFIASILVVIHHIEQFKLWANLDNLYGLHWIKEFGRLGVSTFFVISGFVTAISFLSYLKKGNVSVVKYEVRRLKKLLPLYYMTLAISFLIIPLFNKEVGVSGGFTKITLFSVLSYLLFFPDLIFIYAKPIVGISQSWFLGVQEHFYFFWLWLLKKVKKVDFSIVIYLVLIKFISMNLMLIAFNITKNNILVKISNGLLFIDFESIVIGGLSGYYLMKHSNKKSDKLLFILSISYLFLITFFNIQGIFKTAFIRENLTMLFSIIRSFALAYVVIYLAVNDNIMILRNEIFRKMGKYSYGIYMFHPLITVFLINFLSFENNNFSISNAALYGLTIFLTILLSKLYFMAELKLLK